MQCQPEYLGYHVENQQLAVAPATQERVKKLLGEKKNYLGMRHLLA